VLARPDIRLDVFETLLSFNLKTKKADATGNLLVSNCIGLLFNASLDLHRATLYLVFRIESNDMQDATRHTHLSTDPTLGNGLSRMILESVRSSHDV
jgi:hypothetical protein